jgi:hypothetical protein
MRQESYDIPCHKARTGSSNEIVPISIVEPIVMVSIAGLCEGPAKTGFL